MSTSPKPPAPSVKSATAHPGKATLTKARAAKRPASASSATPSHAAVAPPTPGTKKTGNPVHAEKPVKAKKPKLVRDSFTMPKPEYAMIENLKLRAATLASPVKKSELLRAGIKALAGMTDADFIAAVTAVPTLKTGRPKQDKP